MVQALCVAGLLSESLGWSEGDPKDNLARAHGRVLPRPNTVFVRDGKTARNAVLDVFGPFDTDASTGDFLWARWLQFREPPVRNGAASVQNFIVEFDSAGTAIRSALHSDEELLPVLWRLAGGALPDSPDAFALTAWYWNPIQYLKGSPHRGSLHVQKEQIRFEDEHPASPSIELSLRLLTRITSEEYATDERLHLSLRFRETRGAPRRIKIEASPLETIWLMHLMKKQGVAPEMQ